MRNSGMMCLLVLVSVPMSHGHTTADTAELPNKSNSKALLFARFTVPHRGWIGPWGFVDSKNAIVVDPTYDSVSYFVEGLARVEKAGRFGFINRSGETIVDCRFHDARHFHEGFASVGFERGCGVVDATGRVVTDRIFDWIGDYSGGAAPASVGGAWDFDLNQFVGGKVGFIDTKGKWILAPSFSNADSFSEGLAAVENEGRYGYITRGGRFAIPPTFQMADSFSEGLASVKKDEVWGYINKDGQFVIQPRFLQAGPFSNGLARVTQVHMRGGTKTGFVTRNGQLQIPPIYAAARDFSEGLAAVKTSRGWMYINIAGQRALPGLYDLAFEFYNGVALVQHFGDVITMIDRRGRVLAPRIVRDEIDDSTSSRRKPR